MYCFYELFENYKYLSQVKEYITWSLRKGLSDPSDPKAKYLQIQNEVILFPITKGNFFL